MCEMRVVFSHLLEEVTRYLGGFKLSVMMVILGDDNDYHDTWYVLDELEP